ncbi:6320_t:CDS:1, partial [Funneliformis mosseae]
MTICTTPNFQKFFFFYLKIVDHPSLVSCKGNKSAFKISVKTNNNLSILKEILKEKRSPCFDDFASDELILWRVNFEQSIINEMITNVNTRKY